MYPTPLTEKLHQIIKTIMKPTKLKLFILPAIALGMTAATGQAATVFSDVAVIVSDGFVNTTDSGSVSRDGTGKFYRTLVTFNIQDSNEQAGLRVSVLTCPVKNMTNRGFSVNIKNNYEHMHTLVLNVQ